MNSLDKLKICSQDLSKRLDELSKPIAELDEHLKKNRKCNLPFSWDVPYDDGQFIYHLDIQKGFGDCASWQAIATIKDIRTQESIQKNIRQLKLEHRIKLIPYIDRFIDSYVDHLTKSFGLK